MAVTVKKYSGFKGQIYTTPLITHTYPLERIAEAYDLFENRRDNVIKVAIKEF